MSIESTEQSELAPEVSGEVESTGDAALDALLKRAQPQ